ncbi:MAG: DUF1007 family protein [Tateyamaria sp.]|uniref:DUF1007 family protein n=1 Tax=Tateyamaria sp. TaxID=1929288 RepID=UPI00327CB4AF
MKYRLKRHALKAIRGPLLCGLATLFGNPATGHPHVFVDGGVDFVFENDTLVALRVTWLYDDFETLYILSSYNLSLNAQGGLDENDRMTLVRHRSDWHSDFDGSAHLSVETQPIALKRPTDLDAEMLDGRLRVTFTRELEETVRATGLVADVAFYESTFFYAFAVTDLPELKGSGGKCNAEVVKYDPSEQDEKLQATLARLGREETPSMANVGSLFADRIALKCV